MEFNVLAKLGIALFLYLADLALGSITRRPDLVFPLSIVNILRCSGCLKVVRANFLNSFSRLSAIGSKFNMAKLQ